jgi:hypothetical protein
MIGKNFDKIEFELFGLHLLEPMAMIGDGLMGLLSLFFAYQLFRLKSQVRFYYFWILFFTVLGVGAILGGIGHAFFNQLGVAGKIPSWAVGPLTTYCIERAFISVHWVKKIKSRLLFWANIKMTLVYIACNVLFITTTGEKQTTLPFIPIAINTMIGIIGVAGILSIKYHKRVSRSYRYFWIGVLILLPTAFIFLLKINLHPWFDKNDFSHLLFIIGITFFYLGVKSIHRHGVIEEPTL